MYYTYVYTSIALYILNIHEFKYNKPTMYLSVILSLFVFLPINLKVTRLHLVIKYLDNSPQIINIEFALL